MKTIYPDILELIEARQRFALATVSDTRGSTPQKPGAKAIFLPDGRILGTIGGGCLEAETRLRALDSLKEGGRSLFEMHLDDDFGWDDGLICGGTAQVFIDARVPQSATVLNATAAAAEGKKRAVLAMVVAGPDGAPLGARMLIDCPRACGGEGEPVYETVADEDISAELRTAMLGGVAEALRQRREDTKRIQLGQDEYRIYYEPLLPKPTLLICGAGHVGAALCKLGAYLGFAVTAVDDRPDYANAQRLPEAAEVICDDIVKTVKNFAVTPETYIVVVTRGHRHDAEVLSACIHSEAAYIGMIGSRRKVIVIRDGFIEEGVASAQDFERVHAPIGLDLGAETVEEIALSIVAEMVLVRSRAESRTRANQGEVRKLSDGLRKVASGE